jgi:hypothetical protein
MGALIRRERGKEKILRGEENQSILHVYSYIYMNTAS